MYLSQKLLHNYGNLASLFSEVMGVTIEQFIITHKIDRVKELLVYDKLTLTEISHLMNYSSVAHLTTQFKKVTGFTPTLFKQLAVKKNRQAVKCERCNIGIKLCNNYSYKNLNLCIASIDNLTKRPK